jgi:hypothetical protein
MFNQILSHTPVWVWLLLLLLLGLGYSQSKTRQVTPVRIVIMPIAMVLLSFYSNLSVFGLSAKALGLWFVACAILASAMLSLPAHGCSYNRATRRLSIEGSWIPMAFILSIFLVNFTARAGLAMQHDLQHSPGFGSFLPILYGAFSGLLLGRTLQMLRLVFRPQTQLNASI